jgi:hypothetical protein
VATLAPWYLGVVDIDVRPALRALLTGGALALALMQLDLAKRGEIAAAAPHLLGVIVLGAAWYLLGTFDVTGFLILFAVPTYAAALERGRWTVLCVAALTVTVAAIAAFIANPELRWQLGQIDALTNFLPRSGDALDDLRFASSTAGREQLATLAVFAATIFAVAGVGSSAAGVIHRQARTLQRTDRAHRESASLVSQLLDDSHAMEAIVSPTSGRIHAANRAFREALSDAGADVKLVELLEPQFPERLTHLLTAAESGAIASQDCKPKGQRWILDIDVQPVALDGEPMRRVRLRRTPANDLATAALDELRVAVLVLGPDAAVAFASDAFRHYFPHATAGASAVDALAEHHGLPAHWWDIAPSSAAQVRFQHDDRHCVARIVLTGSGAASALTSIEIRVEGPA